jgi:hypothetical protein
VGRIAAFGDGVFAIAITLLALQMQVPGRGVGTVDVALELVSLWPSFLSFLIRFFVIESYWAAHHRLFAVIERYDRRLIRLDLPTLGTDPAWYSWLTISVVQSFVRWRYTTPGEVERRARTPHFPRVIR